MEPQILVEAESLQLLVRWYSNQFLLLPKRHDWLTAHQRGLLLFSKQAVSWRMRSGKMWLVIISIACKTRQCYSPTHFFD